MDISDISRLSKVVGLRQVTKFVNLDQISLIFLATDADPDFEKQVLELASAKCVPVIRQGTKTQIAQLCDIDKIATVVGVLKQQKE